MRANSQAQLVWRTSPSFGAGEVTCRMTQVMWRRRSELVTAASLTQRSPIIEELVDGKQLAIAAAMHDITAGKVTWLFRMGRGLSPPPKPESRNKLGEEPSAEEKLHE